jgi:hypothetical protein
MFKIIYTDLGVKGFTRGIFSRREDGEVGDWGNGEMGR